MDERVDGSLEKEVKSGGDEGILITFRGQHKAGTMALTVGKCLNEGLKKVDGFDLKMFDTEIPAHVKCYALSSKLLLGIQRSSCSQPRGVDGLTRHS